VPENDPLPLPKGVSQQRRTFFFQNHLLPLYLAAYRRDV